MLCKKRKSKKKIVFIGMEGRKQKVKYKKNEMRRNEIADKYWKSFQRQFSRIFSCV